MLASRLSLSALSLASLFVSSHCMAAEGPRSLNSYESRQYIDNEPGFRAAIDAEGRGPVRFNLGWKFSDFITNADFRGRVLAVVGEDRGRVWSDEVEELRIIPYGDAPLVVDMNDLAGVVNLTSLTVARSQIVNLPAVAALTNLRNLWLENVGGEFDATLLNGLVHLRTLTLSDTQVHRITQLAGLENLINLQLVRTGITDMNDLAGFNHVHSLVVKAANMENVNALTQFPGLRSLSLQALNGDIDMINFTQCPDLFSLTLNSPNLHNVHALAQLPSLRMLELTAINAAINMNDLVEYIHLNNLELNAADLQNVNALAQLPNLENLRLEAQNGDIDVNNFAGYVNLTNLQLSAPNVQNVHAVAPLPRLLMFRVNGVIVPRPAPVVQQFVAPAHAVRAVAPAEGEPLPANAEHPECGICFEAIDDIANWLVTCYGHKHYHRSCLVTWQLYRNSCPNCRTPLGLLP